MRKMSYLIRQTIQSMYYYKKRYLLYILSFYIGMLLPVLCIANYNYIRDMLHYYLFDGIEQSVSLDWKSYSFDGINLDIPVDYTIKAGCEEVFLNWDSRVMSVMGIEKNYYYELSKIKGRMFTNAETDQGEYVCILDQESSREYSCGLNDSVRIKGIDFTVIGVSTDPRFRNQVILPLNVMKKLYGIHDTEIQFTGIFILDMDQNKEQFIAEVEKTVLEKDPEAEILFSDTGENMYQTAVWSVEKWKFLRGSIAFGAALFFMLNELVIIIGKMRNDRKTIAVKMALGAGQYTVACSYLMEIAVITLIADLLIFVSVHPFAKVFALDEIILFDPFVAVVSLLGSMGIAVIITLVMLWNLKKHTISSLMKSEDA